MNFPQNQGIHSIYFDKLDPPTIHPEIEKIIRLPREKSVSVTCSAIGSPELRIVWINGEIETQNNVLMVDSSLEKFDEKNFTCIALNEFGFDSQSVLVQIVGGTS